MLKGIWEGRFDIIIFKILGRGKKASVFCLGLLPFVNHHHLCWFDMGKIVYVGEVQYKFSSQTICPFAHFLPHSILFLFCPSCCNFLFFSLPPFFLPDCLILLCPLSCLLEGVMLSSSTRSLLGTKGALYGWFLWAY